MSKSQVLSGEEQLKDLREMLAAREEALLQVREQKGEQKARQDIAKKLLEIGDPPEKVASVTGLSLEDLQKTSIKKATSSLHPPSLRIYS